MAYLMRDNYEPVKLFTLMIELKAWGHRDISGAVHFRQFSSVQRKESTKLVGLSKESNKILKNSDPLWLNPTVSSIESTYKWTQRASNFKMDDRVSNNLAN